MLGQPKKKGLPANSQLFIHLFPSWSPPLPIISLWQNTCLCARKETAANIFREERLSKVGWQLLSILQWVLGQPKKKGWPVNRMSWSFPILKPPSTSFHSVKADVWVDKESRLFIWNNLWTSIEREKNSNCRVLSSLHSPLSPAWEPKLGHL